MERITSMDALCVPGPADKAVEISAEVVQELRAEVGAMRAQGATIAVDRTLAAALELLGRDIDRYMEALNHKDLSAAHMLEASRRWEHVMTSFLLAKRLSRTRGLGELAALADVELRAIANHDEGAAFSGGVLAAAASAPGAEPTVTPAGHDTEFPR